MYLMQKPKKMRYIVAEIPYFSILLRKYQEMEKLKVYKETRGK